MKKSKMAQEIKNYVDRVETFLTNKAYTINEGNLNVVFEDTSSLSENLKYDLLEELVMSHINIGKLKSMLLTINNNGKMYTTFDRHRT